jgi:predicted RNA polymerase sigma factor
MAGEGRNKPYFQAAMFYYDHGLDLKKAKQWVDAAVEQREAFYIVHLKAKILAKLGDKEGAIAAAKRSTELAKQANDSGYVKLNEDLIASLK